MFDGVTEVVGVHITLRFRFRSSPLVEATLKLLRSGIGQALFARQVRVPWRQHTALKNGATTRLDLFDWPMRLF